MGAVLGPLGHPLPFVLSGRLVEQRQGLFAERVRFQDAKEAIDLDWSGIVAAVGAVVGDIFRHRIIGVITAGAHVADAAGEQVADLSSAVFRHGALTGDELLQEPVHLPLVHRCIDQRGKLVLDRSHLGADLFQEHLPPRLIPVRHALRVRDPKTRGELPAGHAVGANDALNVEPAAARGATVPSVGGVDVDTEDITLLLLFGDGDVADIDEGEGTRPFLDETGAGDLAADEVGEVVLGLEEHLWVAGVVFRSHDAERRASIASVEDLLAGHLNARVHPAHFVLLHLPIEVGGGECFLEAGGFGSERFDH